MRKLVWARGEDHRFVVRAANLTRKTNRVVIFHLEFSNQYVFNHI